MTAAIVTDSAANLPRELRERHGIHAVPIQLLVDGKLYHDEVDLTGDAFYAWLRAEPDMTVSTACPPPGEFAALYEQLAAEHDEIISIHISSALSGTFESAQEAAALVEGPTYEMVDTRSVSMGEGFCVLAAATVLEVGGTAAEAAEAARDVAGRVQLLAALDTVRFVARTGRIPALAAHAGSLLRLRPLVRVTDGRAELRRIEHSRARAIRWLTATTTAEVGGRPAHIAVVHTDAAEEAAALADTLAAECDCVDLLVSEFTPVMGASTGPGLLGVVFYADDPPKGGRST